VKSLCVCTSRDNTEVDASNNSNYFSNLPDFTTARIIVRCGEIRQIAEIIRVVAGIDFRDHEGRLDSQRIGRLPQNDDPTALEIHIVDPPCRYRQVRLRNGEVAGCCLIDVARHMLESADNPDGGIGC
jgi:hypothetical protein